MLLNFIVYVLQQPEDAKLFISFRLLTISQSKCHRAKKLKRNR